MKMRQSWIKKRWRWLLLAHLAPLLALFPGLWPYHCCLTCAAEPNPAAGKNHAQILIVTGEDYPGHHWRETTPALIEALARDERLTVRTIEDPHFLDSAALQRYDAVVLHFMDWESPSPGTAARRNLQQFVADGGGLMLIHFACGAWQDWPEFEQLAGRVYDPALRPHDPFGAFMVRIVDDQHPITAGMEDFETVDELYTCLAGDRPVRMLATARSVVDDLDYPIAFTLEHGKGRIFHCVLGHDAPALRREPVARLLARAAAHIAGLTIQD